MLGNTIGIYRRKRGLTQEQLAKELDVTNQAVSKWETDQCCPDTYLLPRLAQVLEISMDTLFGMQPKHDTRVLPWKDDDAFYIVLYHGHNLLQNSPAAAKYTFTYEGPAKDIHCEVNLQCEDVTGSVNAEGSVECGSVGANVSAGSYVECGQVAGHVNAGSYVECGNVDGNLNAGSYVECGNVAGSVNAASYVECGDVGGSVSKGSPDNDIFCFHFG